MAVLPPLKDGEFRLMKITETKPEVKCEVAVFKILDPPESEYFAISYSWGGEDHTNSVTIGASAVDVTPNLYSCLCELHRREEIRNAWHWIDQICIDQTNKREKSEQVRVMHQIYASAKRVLVWLGPATDDSDLALDNMRALTEAIGTDIPEDLAGKDEIQKRLPPRNHALWPAIVKLFDRSWFKRVWILQEAVLAKGIFVICGGRTLAWPALVDFADAIRAAWPAVLLQAGFRIDDTRINGFVSCSQINIFRKSVEDRNRTLFNNLLITTRDRETSKPIDHVYGILGLVSEEHRKLVNVDYELSYTDGVVAFCKSFVPRDRSLILFTMAPSVHKSPGIPSWCPDFSSTHSETSFLSTYVGNRAGFTDWNTRASKVRLLDVKNAISVPGFRIDVVRNVVQHKGIMGLKETTPEESRKHQQPQMGMWADMANSSKSVFATTADKNAAHQFVVALLLQQQRKFFNTEKGRVGLGPTGIQQGDVVCVFDSGAALYVLRFDESQQKAILVGDAHIEGLMDLRTTSVEDRGQDEWFTIV